MTDHTHYTYKVHWSQEDEEYVGTCLEFPGTSWLERARDDALQGIRDHIHDILLDMEKRGETPPPPIHPPPPGVTYKRGLRCSGSDCEDRLPDNAPFIYCDKCTAEQERRYPRNWVANKTIHDFDALQEWAERAEAHLPEDIREKLNLYAVLELAFQEISEWITPYTTPRTDEQEHWERNGYSCLGPDHFVPEEARGKIALDFEDNSNPSH